MTMNGQFEIGLLTGLLLLAGVLFFRSFFRVQEGFVAALSSLGKPVFEIETEKRLRLFGPGLHLRWPWQRIHSISLMEQVMTLSGESGGKTAMAFDGSILRVDSKLRFAPLASQLYQYLFMLKKPFEHLQDLFTCIVRNEIASFQGSSEAPGDELIQTGSYSALQRQRRQFNQRIENDCQSRFGEKYGIRFNAVDLTDLTPAEEIAEPLNAVLNAQAEADARYARAVSESEQRSMAASEGVGIARSQAKAVEIEIAKLAQELERLSNEGLLDSYISRRKAEVLTQSRAFYIRRTK